MHLCLDNGMIASRLAAGAQNIYFFGKVFGFNVWDNGSDFYLSSIYMLPLLI